MKTHLKKSNYWGEKVSQFLTTKLHYYIRHIKNNSPFQFMEHNSTCLTDENKLKKCVDIGNKILPTKCIIEEK